MIHSGVDTVLVRTRRERNDFIKLPWKIYHGDPHWVPPLLMERRAFINPAQHPFYGHGTAAQFLAIQRGQPVGRILVSDDPRFNDAHGGQVGCFGMFESTDDPAVSTALLDAARQWIADKGRTHLRGPVDYSMNYPCGLLVDGFNTPPRMMMNHNPAYYQPLLEDYGLTKLKDLYAWWFTVAGSPLDTKWNRLADRFARSESYRIRPGNRKNFAAEIGHIKGLYNQMFSENWGFVRLTDAEFDHMVGDLNRLVIPDLCLFAEVKGRPVGFSLTISDVNEALQHINGRLTSWGLPIGLFRFLNSYRKVKVGRLLIIGMLPEFRRRGMLEMLILRTYQYAKDHMGYLGAELGWTLEDNTAINNAIEAVDGKRYKTYRIYEKQIA